MRDAGVSAFDIFCLMRWNNGRNAGLVKDVGVTEEHLASGKSLTENGTDLKRLIPELTRGN